MKKIAVFIVCIFATLSMLADITVYTPTLTSPSDGADYQPPDVLLDWQPVAGEIDLHYEVQVSTGPGFPDPIILTTTMSSVHASELMFDTEYFWRVRAVDQTGASSWSPSRSFTTADVVELYRPKKNDDEIFPNVLLIWDNKHEITGITYWEVELDRANTFNTPAFHRFMIPFVNDTNSVQTSHLYFGSDYFWRVRAMHSRDTTEWSEVWKFETLVTLELKRPKDGAVDQMPDQQMIWDKVDGADAYLYQIDTDPDFSFAKTYETIEDRANADKLHFGETYYWRVMAYHAVDSTEWSEAFSFSVINAVEQVSPADGEVGVPIFPTFKWKSITGILSYCLEIDETPDFNSTTIHKSVPVVATNELTYVLPGPALDSATVYYWRVCALHEYDSTGWGPTWSFRVLATGLDDPDGISDGLRIFPNPGNGRFTIGIPSNGAITAQATVMDLVGQQVLSERWDLQNGLNNRQIDLRQLPAGIYLLRIQREDAVVTRRLIIQR